MSPGQQLSHFQILQKLGEGGMGEVYKAADTRLNRLVAIKVLSPGKTVSESHKRRFMQEAQSASALHHPNIVVVHDINSDRGVDYIVMEYISGRTLEALIPHAGMPFKEALRIAIDVSSGLAKAHRAGIVHRDIKPSNLMVSDDGRVKILDFGLAKLTESKPAGEDEATRTERVRTEEGTIVGTVNYMSPEQAEGRQVDARSDIFSFGAVLYEMLTGHRAFSGSTRMSTISAILREEPKIPETLPAEVDRILRRCLRKDPAKRFQHMDDVQVALEELREESESGKLSVWQSGRRWPHARWLLRAGVIVAALAAGAAIGLLRRPAPKDPGLRVVQLTADTGVTTAPALSPDGKLLAYASDRSGDGNLDIWVQPLTQGARPIRLTRDPANDTEPSFSADGGQIAFVSHRQGGGIYIIPSLGGDERLVVRGGIQPRFSPDGTRIAYCTGIVGSLGESRVFTVPASGGAPRAVAQELGWASTPLWSADGKLLLIQAMDGANALKTLDYWVVPADGGKPMRTGVARALIGHKLTGPPFISLEWSGPELLIAAGNEVWTFRLDRSDWSVRSAQRLLSAPAQLRAIGGRTSKFVFSSANTAFHLWRLPLHLNSGRVAGPLSSFLPNAGGTQQFPSLSLDGKTLAYVQSSPATTEVRLQNIETAAESVILARRVRPKLSPDGSHIAFSAPPGETRGLYLLDAAGGEPKTLLGPTEEVSVYGWSADSEQVIFWSGSPTRFSSIDWRTGRQSILISHRKYNIHNAELSPDGKWVSFDLPEVAARPVKVAPVRNREAASETEWITIAAYPGSNQRAWWSEDGSLLYFLSGRDGNMCIWAQRLMRDNKRPLGDAFAVSHFHETRRAIPPAAVGPFGPAVSRNQLIFALLDRVENIWMAEDQR